MSDRIIELQQDAYDLRLQINRLEEELHAIATPAALSTQLERIAGARRQLDRLQQQLAAEPGDKRREPILSLQSHSPQPVTRGGVTRGAETTGLEATVELKMQYVPTAIYHLLDAETDPFVYGRVANRSTKTRRLRFTSYIEGYSARAVDTVEIPRDEQAELLQLPTLFPERLQHLTELTRATLNVLVDDLDGNVETHKTTPIWLLARNSAPLYVRDPSTNGWNDLTRYLGAFVTPNAPAIMHFLREVADHHPQKQLFGYQEGQDVLSQVRAIFDALQAVQLTYVNSTVTFNPEESARSQRVRLPSESLAEKQANCIDGTLLFASLLEAASLNPALVIIPRHAFVAWETDKKSGQWHYLETTQIATGSFEDALSLGEQKAQTYRALQTPLSFSQWSLRDLRTVHRITPLE
ncbi:MAG TPA: hypothetical protein P5121_06470 [Caldilineaceae bacterium]|nr:hypothetical protein [Caldilineaceae bacterium]